MTCNRIDIAGLAASYRKLVLWFGVHLALSLVQLVAIPMVTDPGIFAVVVLTLALSQLGTVVALAVYSYFTAAALGSRVGILWAGALVVPLVNCLSLLVLSFRATRACRAAGIKVGLLGPKTVPLAPHEVF